MTRAFRQYPTCRGPWDQSGSGSGHATTWARATLQLAMYELQYVLQYIVINTLFGNKQLILVFFFVFISLSTKHNWHHNHPTMAAAGGNAPLAPHMRSCALRRHFE
jgi:hypothetical protein